MDDIRHDSPNTEIITINDFNLGVLGIGRNQPKDSFLLANPFQRVLSIQFADRNLLFRRVRSLLSTMMMSPSFTPASIIERPCTRIKYEESGCGHSIFNPQCPAPVHRCSKEWGNRPPPSHQRKAASSV